VNLNELPDQFNNQAAFMTFGENFAAECNLTAIPRYGKY
jgi:hypothetical protein